MLTQAHSNLKHAYNEVQIKSNFTFTATRPQISAEHLT